jgi:O-antigen ligase
VKRSDLLPVVLIAALPFRIPLTVAGHHANLLLPLYAVIAIGVLIRLLEWGWSRGADDGGGGGAVRQASGVEAVQEGSQVASDDRSRATAEILRATAKGTPSASLLIALLIASVLLYAIQSIYSTDVGQAAKTLAFFLLPFTIMFWLLVTSRWSPRLVTIAFGVAVAEMMVLALVAFVQFKTRHLFWNPELITGNEFQRYFRVNSLFWDPNIFGRYLAIAIVGLATALLWARERRRGVLVAGALAVLWGALALTFSQSSFAGLVAGLVVLAALRWSVRWTAIASGVAIVLAGAYLVAFGSSIKFNLGSQSGLDRATSGRADLVRGGIELAGRRPLYGFGSGSFIESFRRESKRHVAVAASHTEPITVAAEQGAIGLAVYVALIVAAFANLLRQGGEYAVARAGLLAAFAALVLHTMAYDAFLSDPLSWLLLALAVALPAGATGARSAALPPP